MNEFDLFAVKNKKANKTNSFVHFLGESMVHKSAYGFIRPLDPTISYVNLHRNYLNGLSFKSHNLMSMLAVGPKTFKSKRFFSLSTYA